MPKSNKRRNNRNGRRSEPFVTNRREVMPLSPKNSLVTTVLRYAAFLQSSAGGAQVHYFSLINPTKAVDGAGTYVCWSNYEPLYDMYKPLEFAITLYNVNPQLTTDLRSPIFLAADYSAASGGPSITTMLAYSNLKVASAYALGPTQYKFKIPELSQDSTGVNITGDGWINTAVGPTNGIVQMSATGHGVSYNSLYVVLEMVVQFKNRAI